MKSPDMAAISDSLEQSFRNFSLNHRLSSAPAGAAAAPSARARRSSSSFSSSSSSSSSEDEHHRFDTTLELNSHISLPPFWEQCLDLKTGEVYYINCRTGMRVREDPRRAAEADGGGDSEDEEGSEESCSSSSSSSCGGRTEEDVLVVAGCKRCFMYFMVAKQVEDCPKCSTLLVHFDDRSDDNGFP